MRTLGTRRAVAAPTASDVAEEAEEPSKAPKPPSARRLLIIALGLALIALFLLLHGKPSMPAMRHELSALSEPVQSSAHTQAVDSSATASPTAPESPEPTSVPPARRGPWLPTPAPSSEIAAAKRAHTALGLRSLGASPGDAFLLSVRPSTGCAPYRTVRLQSNPPTRRAP